jgi:CRP/FNR family transcriptional regulator, nitrogen fixation regulation protein
MPGYHSLTPSNQEDTMPPLTPALVARQSESPSNRTPRSGSAHALTGTLDIMGAPMSFSRNEEIYGEAEPADYLYKVVSGTVRMYRVLKDGRRQIGAFYLPGDMFGLELGDDQHASSAEAIDDVTVLVFKRSAVLALSARDADVARRLWEMTARELHRAQSHMLLLIKSAQERVISFLLEMAGRGFEADEVTLPMSRQDIADFLGLTIETVSRTISHLEHAHAIALLSSRRVSLCNRAMLSRMNAS